MVNLIRNKEIVLPIRSKIEDIRNCELSPEFTKLSPGVFSKKG